DPASGGRRGSRPDAAGEARPALAHPRAGLRAHRPAQSRHGGRAAPRRRSRDEDHRHRARRVRPGRRVRRRDESPMRKTAERPMKKDAKKEPVRKDGRDGLKAALAPPKIIAAVDLGASKVACFIMKPDGVRRGDRTLTTSGVGYVQSRGIRGGTIVNLDEASEAIAQAVERAENVAGVSVQGVTVSTAGGQLAS